MADKWEVIRHFADGVRGSVITRHYAARLADKAFAQAVAEGFYYAVDVNFLPSGSSLNFEPMYGIANGFFCYWHENRCIWSDEQLNERVA